MYSQDVVAAANSHTLSEEGKLRLRVLGELDAFVHYSDDICLAQEQVRDELPDSGGDSECDASSGNCGDFDYVLHVADSPLGWRSIRQMRAPRTRSLKKVTQWKVSSSAVVCWSCDGVWDRSKHRDTCLDRSCLDRSCLDHIVSLLDETRLALPVRILWLWHLILGVALDAVHLVDIVEGTRLVIGRWDEKHKHTRSDTVAVAVAVSTVAVVVRQLVRANASPRRRLLAAAAATDRLVTEERTTTKTRNNKCVLPSVSCVVAVARLAWRPREHTRAPHIEDDRDQKEGALQPRLVPLRVHEGSGVHGPVQELLVEQDAVDALHYGSTQGRLFGPESAVFIIVFHPSSVLVTVRAKNNN